MVKYRLYDRDQCGVKETGDSLRQHPEVGETKQRGAVERSCAMSVA